MLNQFMDRLLGWIPWDGIARTIDSITGNPVAQTSINGAVPVTTMPGGVVHIREIDALTTTAETLDFSATPIKALSIYVVGEAAAAVLNEVVAICIDPPSNAVRDAWLTSADALTVDSQRIPVIANIGGAEFSFTSPVDYIGIKLDIGADNVRVFAIGVEA